MEFSVISKVDDLTKVDRLSDHSLLSYAISTRVFVKADKKILDDSVLRHELCMTTFLDLWTKVPKAQHSFFQFDKCLSQAYGTIVREVKDSRVDPVANKIRQNLKILRHLNCGDERIARYGGMVCHGLPFNVPCDAPLTRAYAR